MKNLPTKQTPNTQMEVKFHTEKNFLKYPFFDTCRNSARDMIQIKETIQTKDGTAELLWEVSRHLNRGFPAELAGRIHRQVVDKIVSGMKKPISGLVRLGSLRDVCRMLGIEYAGNRAKAIKDALRDIQLAGVRAKWTFYSKAEKKYIDDSFHLYDRIIFAGQQLPDGRIADAIYIVLGSWYVQSVNANYVVPLDFNYHKELKGTVATRMYEWLSLNFFTALDNQRYSIRPRYSTICRDFPLIRQDSKSKAKAQLKDAHHQHVASGYLATEPEWHDITGEKDWAVIYYIGEKAKQEYKRNKERVTDQGKKEIPYEQPLLENVGQLTPPDTKDITKDNSTQKATTASNVRYNEIESNAYKLVCRFQRRKNGRKNYEPRNVELEQAAELIKRSNYNMDVAEYVVDNAIEQMKETNFDAKWFGAVMGYVTDGLTTYDKHLEGIERAAKEEAERKRREDEEKAREEATIRELERRTKCIERARAELGEDEFNEIEQEAIRRLPEIYRERLEDLMRRGIKVKDAPLGPLTKESLEAQIAGVISELASEDPKFAKLIFE